MKIYNSTQNISAPNFTSWTKATGEMANMAVEAARGLTRTKLNPGNLTKVEAQLDGLSATLDGFLSQAKSEIKKGEKPVEGIFVGLMKAVEKITGGKKSVGDVASAVTSVVLIGNVLKEAVGTALYTIQALTNEDLPKDKRRFVGAYDLGVGLTSTAISFILGVGFQDLIKSGYKSLLKGIKGTNPKYEAVLEGLSAFTSFGLQTIVGKRILAPRIGVPVAGNLRKKMEEREARKNGEISMQGTVQHEEYPVDKYGYVDLKTYVARIKERQAKEAQEAKEN